MHKLALALPFLLAAPVAAQEFTSPRDLLGTLYTAYVAGVGVTDMSPYFSDRLTREMGSARLSPEIMTALGVDPLVGATDPLISIFEMNASTDGQGRRATAEISFNNRDVPVRLTFELVHEAEHGWQIDHLEGKSGDISWCSRSIVAASRAE